MSLRVPNGDFLTCLAALPALASLSASDGQKADATRWLEQASAVDANAIAPAVNLIAQYLQTGQNQKALDTAARLQVVHRDNPDLLDLLGKFLGGR